MQITRDKQHKKIPLTQSSYVEKLFDKFGTRDIKSINTSLTQQFKVFSSWSQLIEDDEEYMNWVPYSNVMGCLMYLMICTIPNLTHSVSLWVGIWAD